MAIKCIKSEKILEENDRGRICKYFLREPEANYCKITGRNFVQYKVNPTPSSKMKPLEEKVFGVEIEAEGHMGNVSYIMRLYDESQKILNTYQF